MIRVKTAISPLKKKTKKKINSEAGVKRKTGRNRHTQKVQPNAKEK